MCHSLPLLVRPPPADVSNLPRHFSEVDVQRLFANYGSLLDVTPHRRGDGQSKGCFFVAFATVIEGQQAARALHNCVLPGTQRPMTVRPSTSRRREARAGGNGAPSPEGGQPLQTLSAFTPPSNPIAMRSVPMSPMGPKGGDGSSDQKPPPPMSVDVGDGGLPAAVAVP